MKKSYCTFWYYVLVIVFVVGVSSHAQTTWSKYSGNPVLEPGGPGSWDDNGVTNHRGSSGF